MSTNSDKAQRTVAIAGRGGIPVGRSARAVAPYAATRAMLAPSMASVMGSSPLAAAAITTGLGVDRAAAAKAAGITVLEARMHDLRRAAGPGVEVNNYDGVGALSDEQFEELLELVRKRAERLRQDAAIKAAPFLGMLGGLNPVVQQEIAAQMEARREARAAELLPAAARAMELAEQKRARRRKKNLRETGASNG